ncbi:acetylhydrolase [Plantactinospora sp. WMMB334]|uniref:alpha/beta hydrolase n=1 Tax=Plantactinospora sp. WMMB334 TaxID=3404119 RepID=UPI003B949EE5
MPAMLERTVLAVASLAAVLSLADTTAGPTALVAVAVAAVLSVVRLATNHARWQMVPAYLAVTWLSVGLAVDLPSSARIAGGVVTLMLLALAGGLTTGLPVPSLPRPDGPFGVGTITTMEERHTTAVSTTPRRRLFIKVWYPAEVDQVRSHREGEALWSELREAPGIPVGLRLLTGYLRQVRTHAVRDARFSRVAVPGPVVLYHHALISISAENSLLMESLASHGYVVVSTRHIDQRTELAEVNKDADPAAAARVQEINRDLLGELTRAERARLAHELFQLSAATATIVARRAADARHVLDRLPAVLAAIPGYPTGRPAPDQVAAIGLSLGGAVASELSKADERCAAVVNIDGELYGELLQEPLTSPYLMIYSELNSGGNDIARQAAQATFHEVTAFGAKHLDFHDASVVLPLLRWLGQLGSGSGAQITAWKNEQIRRFLDQTIRATEGASP